jgi:large subunit ribosomal protein L17
MRHAIARNTLGRNSTLRKATVRDIAKATLVHQRISTTKAKAKEARKLIDQLITLGKAGSLDAKRRAFAVLNDHQLVSRLFNRTSPLFKGRNGGYTRIIQLGNRRGDNAQLCFLELVAKEEIVVSEPKTTAAAKKEKIKAAKKAEVKAQPLKEEKQATAPTKVKAEQEKPVKEEPKPPIKETKNDVKGEKPKSKFDGFRKMFQRKAM